MLIYDHAKQPHGGHVFVDPSSHIIESPTLAGLIDAIKLYRKNNGFPAGRPEAEVEIAYTKSHPWLVSKEGEKPLVPSPDPLNRWVHSLWRKPPKNLRDDEVAERRLKVCRSCPHYSEELNLSSDDKRRLVILSASRFIEEAGYCTNFHYACGMVVLTDPMPQDPPDFCWILNGA